MWPFRKKPVPVLDKREWNEDWKVGDTAECIVDGVRTEWHEDIPPWCRPEFRQQFTVVGFDDAVGSYGRWRSYFLKFEGWPVALSTTAFRKVRKVEASESAIVSRILNAKPGADRVREDV